MTYFCTLEVSSSQPRAETELGFLSSMCRLHLQPACHSKLGHPARCEQVITGRGLRSLKYCRSKFIKDQGPVHAQKYQIIYVKRMKVAQIHACERLRLTRLEESSSRVFAAGLPGQPQRCQFQSSAAAPCLRVWCHSECSALSSRPRSSSANHKGTLR